MDRRHLWLRSPRQQAILRVRHEVINAVRDFFDERASSCATRPSSRPRRARARRTLFEVQYFEDKAYLTQSGQLYNEANAMALGKVYCFGPTFRAEKSKTRRHLTEFWMVEPEVAYANLEDVMELAEDLVGTSSARVLDNARPNSRCSSATRRSSSGEGAVPADHLRRGGADPERQGTPFEYGGDLGGNDETVLSQQFDRPVWSPLPGGDQGVLHEARPRAAGQGAVRRRARARGLRRDHRRRPARGRPALLVERIDEHKLPREAFEWYLDLRRYGSVPARRLRPGHRARRRLDLRARARARDDSFPRMLYRLDP